MFTNTAAIAQQLLLPVQQQAMASMLQQPPQTPQASTSDKLAGVRDAERTRKGERTGATDETDRRPNQDEHEQSQLDMVV